MDYLNKMTVKELIEVGKRMQLVSPLSRMRKAELVKLISGMIEEYHSDALKMNESYKSEATYVMLMSDGTEMKFNGLSALMMQFHNRAVRRFNPSMNRDKKGFVKLTPKQRRRIHKKDRAYGHKIGFFTAMNEV